MSISDLISSIQLFEQLPGDVLQKLTQTAKLQYFKKGTLIFDSSRSRKVLVYIVTGWIKLSRDVVDGSEVIIDVLSDKQCIGENMILGNEDQLFNAAAISDLELLSIPMDFLRELVTHNHQFSLNLLKILSKKQQKLSLEMEHLSIKSATQLIGCFLLRLCTLKKSENAVLRFPYDKSLLASRLGMRAETFSRALAKICKECEIKTVDDILHIRSIDKLVEYVCQHCSQTYPCKEIMQ